MNFNQLAAAAAAAGNPNNINMNSFTTAVSNILANSNIDLSQLAGLSQLGQTAALGAPAVQQPPNSRHSLPQAHHHHRSANSSAPNINSNAHLPSSMSNLQNVDAAAAAAAASIAAGLPTSLSNLTTSAFADIAATAAHQTNVSHSSRSLQSAHLPRSNNHHHQQQQQHYNHHSSSAQLTAAHQSSSGKVLAAHQSQNTNLHHRLPSSHRNSSTHSSSFSNFSNNNVKTNLTGNNSLNNLSLNNISNNNLNLNLNTSNISNSTSINNSKINNNDVNSSIQIIPTNNSNPITPPKNSIYFRVGDCVYFESSPTLPLQIGRIDELCKTNGDNIEVKVVVFFRRRDISSSLMTLADKYQYDESQEEEIKQMSEQDKNLLKQRELFYSRQIETIPATSIRGKCTIQLLNESETLASYLSKEDHYFYTLVYDPQQKTITADRGEIRVGQRYQADVQPNPIYKPQPGGDPADPRDLSEIETLVYTPDHNLTDDEINKFLTIAKSVGTFARALDCSSSIKQPSLHLTAASASRDVTLLYAMQLLHQNNYDLGKAVCALVPSTGPVLCRDEIEEWTAGEATLFEEAIEKYGREFCDIRQDFLPWKSVKNIVEYYYMWKTTDRSINQRRMKALEAENKVSAIYIIDPENEMKKSQTGDSLATSVTNITTTTAITPTTTTTPATTGPETTNSEPAKPRSIKRPQESEESLMNPIIESSNATLKRRQVTEQLPKHTTPGENLRFIASQEYKQARKNMITRKQWRHLSRRPWERRVKPKA